MFGHGTRAIDANGSAILAGSSSGQVYSSTPAVGLSTPPRHTKDYKQLKAGMKLPVQSVGNTSMEEIINQSVMGQSGGNNSHPHITVRDRGNYTNGLGNSLISPIVNAQGKNGNVLLTEQRSGRSKLYGGSSCDSGNSASQLSQVYPDNILTEEAEPGELLCRALKTLGLYMKLAGEQERLEGVKPKREKSEEKQVAYEFENDTFNIVNSEAANQALYLIFSAIDAQETDEKFRDCWPVYEKKLEGVFRRVTSNWIKKLLEENPAFFTDLKTEAIPGLLVNPGGDRFIAFLRTLCRYALFLVAEQKKQSIRQQVLHPPLPHSDSEVTSRQIHLLEARQRRNFDEARDKLFNLMKVDLACEQALQSAAEGVASVKEKLQDDTNELHSLIDNNPEIFGDITEAEIQERDEALQGIKMHQFIEMLRNNDGPPDILRERIQAVTKRRTEGIYKSVSSLEDMLQDFSKVWHVLEVDKTQPRVLDCTALLSHMKRDDAELPSVTNLVQSLLTSVEEITLSPALNEDVPEDCYQGFQEISQHVSFQEIMMQEIEKNLRCDKEQQAEEREEMKRRIPLLRHKMSEFDWSQLSGVSQRGVILLVDVSPRKVYDMNKATGRTPGISEFLESSSSSSSNEQLQTSVVKRRSSQLIKSRRSEPLLRNTRNAVDDSVDCGAPLKSCVDAVDTPLSSTLSKSIDLRGSSLFQDSSLATPMSAMSSKSSFRMRKSVSFDNTSTPLTGESSNSMRHRSSSRLSMGPFTPASSSMFASPGISLLEASSRLSIASSISNLDVSTQERLKKLMEACSHPSPQNRSRTSLSPIASSEGGDHAENGEGDNEECKGPSEQVTIMCSNENLAGINREPSFQELFNVSMRDDFEQFKGIMETSYSDLQFGNSDSDD